MYVSGTSIRKKVRLVIELSGKKILYNFIICKK